MTPYAIQKHAATTLHYDLRLELDGVLLSWAIPKGPSLSTRDKRLAVRTADHAMSHLGFEGATPKGGVIVWDRGTWEPIGDPRAGLARGKLVLVIHGEKLRGRFRLLRFAAQATDRGRENWLLVKGKDEHAHNEPNFDIVSAAPRSVLTGRTLEEVIGLRQL